jgi:hypothetical protein
MLCDYWIGDYEATVIFWYAYTGPEADDQGLCRIFPPTFEESIVYWQTTTLQFQGDNWLLIHPYISILLLFFVKKTSSKCVHTPCCKQRGMIRSAALLFCWMFSPWFTVILDRLPSPHSKLRGMRIKLKTLSSYSSIRREHIMAFVDKWSNYGFN